jgi:putative Holliday junction resolvase
MSDAALTVLGFDYGERRIGVAVGQTLTCTASPLRSVAVRCRRPDWDKIALWVREYQPQRFVLGLPLNPDNGPHPMATHITRFGRQLKDRFHLPVEFIDERLSSHEAAGRAAARATTVDLDAEAACVILESWLRDYAVLPREPAAATHA